MTANLPVVDSRYGLIRLASEIRRSAIENVPRPAGMLALNPCLISQGQQCFLAVRLESPQSYWRDQGSWDPEVRFFERLPNLGWRSTSLPVFPHAEDPFATWVEDGNGGKLLVFGVVSLKFGSGVPTIVTKLYVARTLSGLDPTRPILQFSGMKDVRLLSRPTQLIVCGRPQGRRAFGGRMSIAVVRDIWALRSDTLIDAHVFEKHVVPGLFLGANELYDLGDDIGVLGHVAIGREGGERHYAAAWWTVDAARLTASAPAILAVRSDFPAGPIKGAGLADVVFPGSLETLGEGQSRLYCGLSDAAIGSVVLDNPADLSRSPKRSAS